MAAAAGVGPQFIGVAAATLLAAVFVAAVLGRRRRAGRPWRKGSPPRRRPALRLLTAKAPPGTAERTSSSWAPGWLDLRWHTRWERMVVGFMLLRET
uniref:Pco148653 n=1 Tax=Arundo donax TaxID=35708 RepID=A0A0A9DC97_ARUDO